LCAQCRRRSASAKFVLRAVMPAAGVVGSAA
jgi:hypothetical protein